jgi:hypothetical protein
MTSSRTPSPAPPSPRRTPCSSSRNCASPTTTRSLPALPSSPPAVPVYAGVAAPPPPPRSSSLLPLRLLPPDPLMRSPRAMTVGARRRAMGQHWTGYVGPNEPWICFNPGPWMPSGGGQGRPPSVGLLGPKPQAHTAFAPLQVYQPSQAWIRRRLIAALNQLSFQNPRPWVMDSGTSTQMMSDDGILLPRHLPSQTIPSRLPMSLPISLSISNSNLQIVQYTVQYSTLHDPLHAPLEMATSVHHS